MMMMTAKVNIKKVLIGLIAAVALIIALVSLLGGADADPAAVTMTAGYGFWSPRAGR